jgi:putative aldouronate transport system permease protein
MPRIKAGRESALTTWKKSIRKYWQLYLLLIPVIASFIIFNYMPMAGIQIAFKDFSLKKGIWGSDWIGLYHFQRFFSGYKFTQILSNTIILSLQSLLFTFPFPIIFALALNEIKRKRLKAAVQTITFAPHFISTVVVVGMMTVFLLPSTGIINVLLMKLGLIDKGIYFTRLPQYFRPLYIISGLWASMGWSSIIYISSISAIDPQLYEAAEIDGAGKFRQMIHVTLAGIRPVIITMLILHLGSIMSVGFEKVFLMQTSTNLVYSEVISTYVYDRGISAGQYDFATAVGLFNSVINLILIVIVNKVAKKFSEVSLW